MSHPSHKTRLSDSSLCDEVCTLCGANDGRNTHNPDALENVCPQNVRRFEHATVLLDGPFGSFLMLDHIKAGQYRFPGGTLEWGEVPLAAAARELKEELGIELHAVQLITEKYHHVSGKDWHGYYFHCSEFGGTPRVMEPTKHRGIKYMTLREMELGTHTQQVHASDYEIARKYHFPRG
jgi:ADP-ribose pyrophosphatase YjhB (NUDIX family)